MYKLAVTVAFVVGGAVASAHAAPAKTPAGTIKRAFACVKNPTCTGADIFTGKALREWNQMRPRLGKQIKISDAKLVAQLPVKLSPSKRRRWNAAATELAKRGYSKRALLRLGHGQAIVRIGPHSAIALLSMRMDMGSGSRQEYLLFSMVKQGVGWHIAFIEDSPSQHVRFWKKRRP